jgi:hypothetical protein
MKSSLATTGGFLSHFCHISKTTTMKLIAAAHMHHASNQILGVFGSLRVVKERVRNPSETGFGLEF